MWLSVVHGNFGRLQQEVQELASGQQMASCQTGHTCSGESVAAIACWCRSCMTDKVMATCQLLVCLEGVTYISVAADTTLV
jgi:hypothetical protein